jgi:hypothetical protein
MERIDTLNERLAERFGKFDDGRPWYKLVWTTDQTEIRRGNFNEFYGNIFLRSEINVVKEVPKYYIGRDRWALEKLFFSIDNPELVNAGKGTYEPIWIFQDKDENYLHPIWPAIELIVKAAEGQLSEKLQPSDYKEEDAKKLIEEIRYFEDVIENEASLFAFKDSVAIGKTDMWDRSKK